MEHCHPPPLFGDLWWWCTGAGGGGGGAGAGSGGAGCDVDRVLACWPGSTQNNIVGPLNERQSMQGGCVYRDDRAEPEARYKLLTKFLPSDAEIQAGAKVLAATAAGIVTTQKLPIDLDHPFHHSSLTLPYSRFRIGVWLYPVSFHRKCIDLPGRAMGHALGRRARMALLPGSAESSGHDVRHTEYVLVRRKYRALGGLPAVRAKSFESLNCLQR